MPNISILFYPIHKAVTWNVLQCGKLIIIIFHNIFGHDETLHTRVMSIHCIFGPARLLCRWKRFTFLLLSFSCSIRQATDQAGFHADNNTSCWERVWCAGVWHGDLDARLWWVEQLALRDNFISACGLRAGMQEEGEESVPPAESKNLWTSLDFMTCKGRQKIKEKFRERMRR